MPLFEIYIFVDWSARNEPASKCPSKDSIWTEISSRLEIGEANANNRFIVASELYCIAGFGKGAPFRGVPGDQATDHLHSHDPGYPFKPRNGAVHERARLTGSRLRQVQET